MFLRLFTAFNIMCIQSIGYYFLKLSAKDIKLYFLGGGISFNWFFFICFTYTVFAKISSSIFFGVLGDLIGLNAVVQIPVLISCISLLLFFLLPSYLDIGLYSMYGYSIAYVLYQISIAGEMQNLRLYVTSILPGYLGEGFCLMSKYFAVLIAMLAYNISASYNIHFQYIFFLLLTLTIFNTLLRSSLSYNAMQANDSSLKEISSNIIRIIKFNTAEVVFQVLNYGVIGGILYFYCVFISIMTSGMVVDHSSYNINIIIVIGLILGCVFGVFLENLITCFAQLLLSFILQIVSLYMIYNSIFDVDIFCFWLFIGAFSISIYNIAMLYLLRHNLPKKFKGTFLGVFKSLGSLSISNLTINVCFSLYHIFDGMLSCFVYIGLLLMLSFISYIFLKCLRSCI